MPKLIISDIVMSPSLICLFHDYNAPLKYMRKRTLPKADNWFDNLNNFKTLRALS